MPLSVRLDPHTESVVKRLARRHKQTQSAVVREAIAAYARDETAHPPEPSSPWEAVRHLVGVANSEDGRLSQNTGEGLRALVQKKARARRPR
jgi:predicted transcriptional regulator